MNGRSVASETQTEVTQILQEWSAGDEGAPAHRTNTPALAREALALQFLSRKCL